MHPAAYDYVSTFREDRYCSGLDIGGRDVNGSARDALTVTSWTVLDKVQGLGVDLVVDATRWLPLAAVYDLVLCTEVLEHEPAWPQVLGCAWAALRPGGRLILTCAGPGRPVHSGIDGGSRLHEGEWYGNVDPGMLLIALRDFGFGQITVHWAGEDLHCTALKVGETR